MVATQFTNVSTVEGFSWTGVCLGNGTKEMSGILPGCLRQANAQNKRAQVAMRRSRLVEYRIDRPGSKLKGRVQLTGRCRPCRVSPEVVEFGRRVSLACSGP